MNRIKKYETGIVGSFLLSLLLLFSSCQNTGLMYDVSQPGTVYFVKKASADAPVCSFVFEVEDEITYEVPVKLMGMPCNYDREFVVTLKQDTMTTIKAGGVSYPVETAELGKDFDMGNTRRFYHGKNRIYIASHSGDAKYLSKCVDGNRYE